jgi:hypothetical protein
MEGAMNLRHMLPASAVITLLSVSPAVAGPVTLTCAPGQRAIVRESLVRGAPVTSAQCVNARASRVVYERARYHIARPHRSWGKTALTIAGGAATGAGIGGIAGGKKGALVGSALGGGAATLYESVKRR